jgi:hypothetical protein
MASTFRCQECKEEYFVLDSAEPPDTKPACIGCGAQFPEKDGDIFLHYFSARYIFD